MKVEITIVISEDLMLALDRQASGIHDRSAIMEEALRAYLAQPWRGEDAGDLEIINSRASELNEEAADVLEYQISPYP